jgi:bifunctional UDP-N-acetylglucosamine pyrophosphorylase/glucosamine-1-phosphate N-acetyltransferase
MVDGGEGVVYRKISYWLDTSYPWDLLPANESLLAAMEPENLGEVEENVVLKGAVSIGRGTVIKSGSYIEGPVIIGAECNIGPNCYIRPSTAVADGCHIGAAVEIKNSIIMKDTKIPHHNYVGDSVIGERCNLGAGTKVANLRLDDKQIIVAGRPTGRRKLGVIMGDDVGTGINSCINIGTIIGNNTQIGPGALAHGVISPDSKIF